MTTSDKYSGTNVKPSPVTSKSELIALEHQWRLQLKSSGFSDIEMWDNKPRRKVKRVKFIKGHIRLKRYKGYANFKVKWSETADFYRVIGLYAHHAPLLRPKYEQYRELLKDYAESGYIIRSIRKVNPRIKSKAVEMYLVRHFHEMLAFVNKLEQEEEYDHRLRAS